MTEQSTVGSAHHLSGDEAVAAWSSDRDLGLTSATHRDRLGQWGPNVVPSEVRESLLIRLGREFVNPLTAVLALAVGLTIYLGDYVDAVVIGAVIIVNALIGFSQEYRAEKALQHVSRLLSPHAHVIRDGVPGKVDARSLVPGDIILLDAGSSVVADARVLLSEALETNESTLTGESTAVTKTSEALTEDVPLAERHNMVFAGTTVTRGSARAMVVATGARTELGTIGQMMRQVGRLRTPLTRRLDRLAQQITAAVVVVSLLTLAWGLWVRDLPFDFLFLAVVGLAVGAIPEGLPAVISFALASSAKTLASHDVLVRRLPAVEALGSVSMVFTDKTGTLTKNEMTAVELRTEEGVHPVSGVGYQPVGEIEGLPSERNSPAWWALMGFSLCNDAKLVRNGGDTITSGDPTELALVTLAEKAGINTAELVTQFPRIAAIPFESESQYMATHHRGEDEEWVVIKGSPERVLTLCRDGSGKSEDAGFEEWVEAQAEQGRRVLMVAIARGDQLSLDDLSTLPLTPMGAVALIDPPQPDAVDALSECQRAGVRVVMVTGDHPQTAWAIGQELGFPPDPVLVGTEIDALSDDELVERVHHTSVIARATPAHKLRLVQVMQARGDFVAMTGDGVNDAPALRQAHIGVAMGKKGTDVAKEAADIVITDDRFATIARAIREGRRVYDNIKKSLLFLLSTDLDEAVLIMAAVLFGFTLPVTPTQILWVNLVTSVTLSFALILEKAEPSLMRRGPNPKSLSLLTGQMLGRIALASTLAIIATLAVFHWQLSIGVSVPGARTAAVSMLVAVELAILVNHRRFTAPAWGGGGRQANPSVWVVTAILVCLQMAFVYLPEMNQVFGSAPMTVMTWIVVIGAAIGVFVVLEIEKLIRRRVFRQEVF